MLACDVVYYADGVRSVLESCTALLAGGGLALLSFAPRLGAARCSLLLLGSAGTVFGGLMLQHALLPWHNVNPPTVMYAAGRQLLPVASSELRAQHCMQPYWRGLDTAVCLLRRQLARRDWQRVGRARAGCVVAASGSGALVLASVGKGHGAMRCWHGCCSTTCCGSQTSGVLLNVQVLPAEELVSGWFNTVRMVRNP